jgi:tetratricopeptide (TPR) repeat protein
MTDRSLSVVADGLPRDPYIVRPETEQFLEGLAGTLRLDGARLFQVWGVGGVGKTTVLRKARERLAGRVVAADVSFGTTDKVDEPIGLMEALAKDLTSDDWGAIDTSEFAKLIKLYRETEFKLGNEPIEKGKGISEEQKTVVQSLGNIALGLFQRGMPEDKAKEVDELGGKMLESGLNTASAALTLFQKHQATKGNKQLQELMQNPIPKLTEAFAKLLRGQGKPVLLVLDTYEKAPLEIDNWLWRSLLGNQDVGAEGLGNTRILVAGRNSLVDEREGWRKLQQDRDCVRVLGLDRFDVTQTQRYLQDCGVTDDRVVEQIYGVTKGLPYYLDWIRKELQAGRKPDFSKGNEDIAKLLLQGLSREQQRLIEIAACFRQFKKKNLERVLKQLTESQGVDFAAAAGGLGAFGWLTDREVMQFVEKRDGHYRLDDVARDVFRLSLFEEDEELFRVVQGVIAADYLEASNQEEPEDAGYRVRYENADWRGPRAAYLYHLLLSGERSAELVFRSHLLEARYFRVDQLVRNPLRDLVGEFGLERHPFLRDKLWRFLVTLRPAVERGWAVLEEFPVDYSFNENKFQIGKAELDDAVQVCLAKPGQLTGLAKFAALVYQSGRCLESRRLDYLGQAEALTGSLVDPDDDEFSSGLYLWQLGNRFYGYGQKEKAIASFDQSIAIKPDLHEAWNNRGNSLDNLGRREEAIASFDQAIAFKPDDHEAWYNRGVSLDNLGRIEEAIASFDQSIAIKPDLHEAWNNRGNSLDNLGRREEAIASFDQAIAIKPDDHKAWNNRGLSLANLGRIEEAIASYDQAIALKPDLHEAWTNRGVSLANLGRIEEAIASYDQAIAIKPDDHKAWNNRGLSLANLGRIEEAIASYDQAIAIKPDLHEAWYSRGVSLANLGRREEAIASYDQAIAFKPDKHEAWFNRGNSLDNLGRRGEAVESYDQAIAIKPDYHQAWNNRGDSLRSLKRYEEAEASYSRAIELKPDYRWPWHSKGFMLAELKRYEEALVCFEKAIELNGDDEVVWDLQGDVLAYLDRYDEAIQSYSKAIEIKPEWANSWADRGRAYARIQQYETGLVDVNRAIELKPDLDWAIGVRGALYLCLGRYNDALDIFNQILEKEPESDGAYYICRAFAKRALTPTSGDWQIDLTQAIQLAQADYDKDPSDWDNHFNLALYHLAAAHHPEATALYQTGLDAAPTWAKLMAHRDLLDYLHLFPDHPEAQQWSQQLG